MLLYTTNFSGVFRVFGKRSKITMDPSHLQSPQLQHLIEQEKQKVMANEVVAKLTNKCWDTCITGTPGSKFSSTESTCLTNCARRYLDMSKNIMTRFQSMH